MGETAAPQSRNVFGRSHQDTRLLPRSVSGRRYFFQAVSISAIFAASPHGKIECKVRGPYEQDVYPINCGDFLHVFDRSQCFDLSEQSRCR